MLIFEILCLLGLCGAFYLIIKSSDVLKEHKSQIDKNMSAIELLAKRFDEEGDNNEL